LKKGKKIVGIQALLKDVTNRKRKEEEQKNLQAQLSNAMEMAHLGHWEYDMDSDTFTFNDYFYKIFRTNVEEVGGYTMSSAEYARRFIHPDEISIVGEEVRKSNETTDPNYTRQLERRILYADGTVGYIAIRFFIVKDAHNRTVKTFGVNQDITELKLTEDRLRESEQKCRLLAENVCDTIWMMDLNQQRLTYLSPSVKKMTGYSPEEAMKLSLKEILTPES
jgi:PAS domain-containing protein